MSPINPPPLLAALTYVPDGPAGVLATLKLMRKYVHAAKLNPVLRHFFLQRVSGLASKDFVGEANTLYTWVKAHIRYVRDIRGVETLQTPEYTLREGQGDCDDQAVLLASGLELLGHPTRFVAIAQRPGDFTHVYVETKIGPRWVAMETTEPWPLGKVPRSVDQIVVYN